MPILAKLVYRSGAEPVGLLAVRFPIAAALLTLLVITRGDSGTPALRSAGRPTLLALALLGAIGYAGQALSYFVALTSASASLVALILYVYPVFVVIIAAVALRHRPRPAAVACLALALAGTAVTLGPVGGGQVTGALLAVLAALFYAVYIVVGSRVTPRVGALRSTAVIMTGAAVTLVATAAVTHPRLPGTPAGWLALGGLVVVCTVLAPLTFFAGLARIGPTDAATISTVEPVVSVLLGVVVLGERLTALQLAGAVLVLGAVVALARLGVRPSASRS
jgi:drug/metabolite transporter (DMT)-like permease